MSYEHASTSVGTIEIGLSVCRNGYSTFFGINPHIFMSQRRSPAPKLCHAPVTRTVTGTSIANGYGTLVVEGKKNDEAPQAPTRTAPQAQCPSYHEVCHRKLLQGTSRGRRQHFLSFFSKGWVQYCITRLGGFRCRLYVSCYMEKL